MMLKLSLQRNLSPRVLSVGRESIEQNIISLLQKSNNRFISGEKISSVLGVSRAAVWKYIKKLREGGFRIEALPRRGYCLKLLPDKLYGHIVSSDLDTRVIGKKSIYHYEDIDSTNAKAYELADKGAEEGTVVFAETQSRGKGRMGRAWISPSGGIYMSIVLRPRSEPSGIGAITLVSALAIARAIQDVRAVGCGIKWPNDILIEGKKVCGILTEIKAESDKIDFLILGIGINVNVDLKKLPKTSTSLQADRIRLVQCALKEIEKVYYQFLKQGFVSLRDECKALSCVIKKQVVIKDHARLTEGVVVDIDERGAMVVKTDDGALRHIFSGDVMFR
ncbi:MAG: biotin--[acetyl-CoA-carboxylase] ligase [Candidatus Omnitrophota bacterium]